jgi:adenylosuccinate synthase
VTVVGAQWGDEGKGKIVDWLAAGGAGGRFGAVVRFNGGHNAGHTLVVDGRTYRLTLVPSGVLTGTPGVIGAGVVVDPFALLDEIERLRRGGVAITPETLQVAETVTLVLPVHQTLDRLREAGSAAIGTTGRGIGPAYEDKAARRAIRLCDVLDGDAGRDRVAALLEHHNATFVSAGLPAHDLAEVWPRLQHAAARLAPYVGSTAHRLRRLGDEGEALLFEGAQSVMLDVDHGTYPFVTSSSCVPASAASGSAMSADSIGTVVGVAKAYATRVGAGPFPTEDPGTLGRHLLRCGNEVGTNTGRPRRCGALDAVLLRHACQTAGVHQLALTKLDVLDGLTRVRIATAYTLGADRIEYFPARLSEQGAVLPVYEELAGWSAALGLASMPTMSRPRSARALVRWPCPHPTSSTLAPAGIATRRSSRFRCDESQRLTLAYRSESYVVM